MTISKAQRLHSIHQDALQEFDEIQTALREERNQCVEDRRFYSQTGAQWEGGLGDQFENKPRFEFNKVHLAVIRIFNEYRNNRITVDFQPRDGAKDDKLADVCDGLYRADEKACTADEADDNCFEEGVGGGFGAIRLRAVYEDDEDDENDRQRVAFEPIFDADSSVFFNLDAKRYDKADAERCFVLTPYTRRGYEAKYGDSVSSWPKAVYAYDFDWCTPDMVWVCELYCVEDQPETVHFFAGLADPETEVRYTDDELTEEKLAELAATGWTETRTKRVKRRKIVKYVMSGGKMLTEGEVIPGRCIPIAPYYGKRWVLNGVERCMGHVRLAKDAQRLVNMLLSWLAQMAARFDIEKPIMAPSQIAGHAHMWATDNVDQFPYLLANNLLDGDGNEVPGSNQPMGYTKAPNIPPAVAALTQIAMQALEDLLGNQQAGEEVQPNLSGKAVELIQNRLDMQVFIYMSNFAKTKKRVGEIWLSMKKALTAERNRRMKMVGPNGETSTVIVNQPAFDPKTGKDYIKHDLSAANYEVDVDVGPSSTSRRAATVRSLTGMMQLAQDPDTIEVLTGLSMMNMEGEGISDVRDYFRQKMVRKGVIKPTEDELQQLQQEAANQQPDPQAQYLQAAADEAMASAEQKRAGTVETIASADLKRAQTAKTYAEALGEQNQQWIASATALKGILTPPTSRAIQ